MSWKSITSFSHSLQTIDSLLKLLRKYFIAYKPKQWLFEGPGGNQYSLVLEMYSIGQ